MVGLSATFNFAILVALGTLLDKLNVSSYIKIDPPLDPAAQGATEAHEPEPGLHVAEFAVADVPLAAVLPAAVLHTAAGRLLSSGYLRRHEYFFSHTNYSGKKIKVPNTHAVLHPRGAKNLARFIYVRIVLFFVYEYYVQFPLQVDKFLMLYARGTLRVLLIAFSEVLAGCLFSSCSGP